MITPTDHGHAKSVLMAIILIPSYLNLLRRRSDKPKNVCVGGYSDLVKRIVLSNFQYAGDRRNLMPVVLK